MYGDRIIFITAPYDRTLNYISAEFLKYCGKTMCIINPSKGEYVRVKTRNSAIKMLDDLQNW